MQGFFLIQIRSVAGVHRVKTAHVNRLHEMEPARHVARGNEVLVVNVVLAVAIQRRSVRLFRITSRSHRHLRRQSQKGLSLLRLKFLDSHLPFSPPFVNQVMRILLKSSSVPSRSSLIQKMSSGPLKQAQARPPRLPCLRLAASAPLENSAVWCLNLLASLRFRLWSSLKNTANTPACA